MKHPNYDIMQALIEYTKANYHISGYAVGAFVIQEDEILSSAVSTHNIENDITCHAEINAIRLASKKIKNRFLTNCYIYTTYGHL